MARHQFKTTNIKGKQYVEVNERIKFFRESGNYNGWSLSSEIVHLDSESCVIRAEIRDDQFVLRATGFAQEDKSSSYINKTSFVDNCETSAWGRALANLGIGIDTSIASSNEVQIAIAKQNTTTTTTKKPVKAEMTDEIKAKMIAAVKDGKADMVTKALDKYDVTPEVIKEILS
jgi:hypothetical protein